MQTISRWSVVFVLALALATPALAQTNKVPQPAKMVIGEAMQKAKAQQKNVMVVFGASWCGFCKQLDAMLESKAVGKLFQDNFVITHLTIQESKDKVALENPGAQVMADAAGAKDAGIPIFIFFDAMGTRLATSMAMPDGKNIGHPVTPEEIVAFDGLLKKTAPRMTTAERKQISDYLAKQKK
jgi:thioredoxin-related protein